jgi:hypothetical protein
LIRCHKQAAGPKRKHGFGRRLNRDPLSVVSMVVFSM